MELIVEPDGLPLEVRRGRRPQVHRDVVHGPEGATHELALAAVAPGVQAADDAEPRTALAVLDQAVRVNAVRAGYVGIEGSSEEASCVDDRFRSEHQDTSELSWANSHAAPHELGQDRALMSLIGGDPLVCRGCHSHATSKVVDLGAQAASDHFPRQTDPLPDAVWPLELWLCSRCALVQLGPVVPLVPEPVRAVESATSKEHARHAVRSVLRDYPSLRGTVVCEFASHHGGSWLDELTAAGCRVADDTERAGLVVDVHGIAHETDVRGALDQRVARLADGGLLVLEFHHLLPLVTGNQYDTIRHGHWSYLSLTAVQRLAGDLGLQVVAATGEPVFGGSLRVLAHPGRSGLGARGKRR